MHFPRPLRTSITIGALLGLVVGLLALRLMPTPESKPAPRSAVTWRAEVAKIAFNFIMDHHGTQFSMIQYNGSHVSDRHKGVVSLNFTLRLGTDFAHQVRYDVKNGKVVAVVPF